MSRRCKDEGEKDESEPYEDFEDTEEQFEYEYENDGECDTAPCPFCNEEIYDQADVCPHCGNFVFWEKVRTKPPPWVLFTALMLLGIIILAITGMLGICF